MSEPYVGEIRMFAGTFAPLGWAFCDGSNLSIAAFERLFTLIGTTYGGDGQTSFALPDLRGRHPVQVNGAGYQLGSSSGAEAVTLSGAQIPAHSHTPFISSAATGTSPEGALWARQAPAAYSGQTPSAPLANDAVASVGGTQPHENMPPFVAVPYIIALEGIFPSFS